MLHLLDQKVLYTPYIALFIIFIDDLRILVVRLLTPFVETCLLLQAARVAKHCRALFGGAGVYWLLYDLTLPRYFAIPHKPVPRANPGILASC